MDNKKIILISGGCDPIHRGHVALIQESFKIGQVVVLLNSDNWLREKKGKEFLPFNERKIIMGSIKGVIEVIEFNDSNKTCIEGIKIAKKNIEIILFILQMVATEIVKLLQN